MKKNKDDSNKMNFPKRIFEGTTKNIATMNRPVKNPVDIYMKK
jgi:hypothetical protein